MGLSDLLTFGPVEPVGLAYGYNVGLERREKEIFYLI